MNLAGWLAAATTLMMGTIYSTSRILYAQSQAGQLLRVFGRLHRTRKTPVAAIAFVWAASVILVLIGMRDPAGYYEYYGLQLVFAWMVS